MKTRHLATAIQSAFITATIGFVATSNPASAASLTIFHNNDGESKLLGSGSFGGFDYFLGELDAARSSASASRDVLTISSGDNFLAGIAWSASVARRDAAGGLGSSYDFGGTNLSNYYDAMALSAVEYDVITLGNHDFDFGPAVLGDFISGYEAAGGTATFLSANLDFSSEPALQPFTTGGTPRIASSTTVNRGGEIYGIIGATTASLATISSPGPNITIGDVATAVNAELAALTGAGVNKIILSSHLQGINAPGGDEALIPLLDAGVDVIIAGGGDELLRNGPDANTDAPFGPGIDGPYPLISTATDSGGNTIALVTTQGEYRYIGELEVEFDGSGNVTSLGGNAILVDPATSPQAVGTFNGIDIQNDIITPLAADVAAIEASVVATTDVPLDGRRASIRTIETNLGDLIADAFIWQAQQIGGLTGDPVIAFTNGGGIRNDSVIGVGNITAADAIDILPFDNSIVTLNGVTVADLVATLETAVKNAPGQSGGFLQIGGFEFTYSTLDPALSRVLSVELADGTLLYTADAGDVFGGTLDIVTNNFSAAGGDGFSELATYFANDLSVGDDAALVAYIQTALGGAISGVDYPELGLNRINPVPLPAGIWLLGSALGVFGFLRRRPAAA